MLNFKRKVKDIIICLAVLIAFSSLAYAEGSKSLTEQLSSANKRHQPYINLTNQMYVLTDLFNPAVFNEYKKLELKSLYLRTSKVNLDEKFASEINELAKIGIREVVMFFYQDQPSITTQQFNHFVEVNKICINLMLIPVSEKDIENIRADSIGKKDILGFKNFSDNKIIYKDGYSLALLNNEETSNIILHNYIERTRRTIAATTFAVQEPMYITSSDPADEKRTKNTNKIKKPFSVEVSKNIDLNAQAEQQLEEESELDLDKEQADNKFDEKEAAEVAKKLVLQSFYEEDMNGYEYKIDEQGIGQLIHSLFASVQDMKFITSKALELVAQNYFLFRDGVDIDNLPIGFAYKDHILFVSDQRRSVMPINEFTVKIKSIKPYISNPNEYSWLPFATQGSISLNDIYGSDVAPSVYGKDEHPDVVRGYDIMLDIPRNIEHMAYTLNGGRVYHVHGSSAMIKQFFAKSANQISLNVFPGIYFYDLSESDRQKLEEIYANLQKRGLVEIFNNIIRSEHAANDKNNRNIYGTSDGGFLLEEGASLFFSKLFQEILPITDSEKQKFFIEILKEYKFAHSSSPEDVFEGLDGFYKKIKEFMVVNEIASAVQEEILSRSISVIKKQMEQGSSFKVLLGRLVNILELVNARGGSIKEQLEYLDGAEGSSILKGSEQYWKAKDLGINTIHSSLDLSDDKKVPVNKYVISRDSLIKQIFEKDYLNNLYTNYFDTTINAMRHLATIPPHQRPSIATYFNYFNVLDNPNRHFAQACYPSYYPGSTVDYNKMESLRTMEYTLFDEVFSRYQVERSQQVFAIIDIDKSNTNFSLLQTEHELGEKYFLFVIEDGELITQLNDSGFSRKIKFSDIGVSGDEVKLMISGVRQYIKNKNEVSKLTEVQLMQLYGLFPDEMDKLGNILQSDPEYVLLQKNQNEAEKVNSPIVINFAKNNTYDLYLEKAKLNKEALILPTVLDERIQQCRLNRACFYIKLSPSEIAGTFFESFPAPFVKDSSFYYKSYDEKKDILDSTTKEKANHNCYAAIGVIADDANLVTQFTTAQAAENTKLLALNILSSTGEHYDRQYPDQEFSPYLSLFNVLFSDIKMYDAVKANTGHYVIEQDFNYKTSYTQPKYSPIDKGVEIKDKETQHKKIVGSFVNTYKDNPSFNFVQVVSLGLVDVFDHDLADGVIKKAKVLLQYNGYFTQMLRVLLSTPTSSSNDSSHFGLDELRARGKAVVRAIDNLLKPTQVVNSPMAHDLLTQNGKHPENLALFAATLGQEQELNDSKINTFLSKLATLGQPLKDKILESFATTNLPYANGKIINNNFPSITLEDLDNPAGISNKLELAKSSQISVSNKTMFNDANVHAIEQSQIDFGELEDKYKLSLTSEVKSKRFSDIRKNIIEDKDFIKINLVKSLEDQELVQKIHFDLAVAIFSVFSQHNVDGKREMQKSMTFLFDPKKRLEDQFLAIEFNHSQLAKLPNKEELLDHLLAEPNIPNHIQDKVLSYLNSVNQEALQTKGYTLPRLVKSAGNKITGQYFDVFTMATNMFIQSDVGISLEELYRYIESLADAKYSSSNIQAITAYCLDHLNYSMIPILAKVDGQADHIDELVSFMVRISPEDIERLDKILGNNFETLLAIKEVKKINIVMNIALKFDKDISKKQYSLLVKQVMKNDINYTKLIGSYLLINNVPKKDTKKDRVNTVFSNLDHLERAQTIFSNYNLERFNYDDARVRAKIGEIRNKNTDSGIGMKIYADFTSVMVKARACSALNINEIRAKAIELKRRRALLKEHAKQEIEQIDLDYLALSFEALYRSTGMFPRDTQVLSVLLGATNSNHIIEEIATGQGKSLIAALQAAYLCYTGQTVDVVTSSQDLAKANRQEFALFYQNLGLTISPSVITASSEISTYKKWGINYAVASDLALFRANREFYSNTMDLELNTDVSLIGDEVDYVLTSGINFKLAAALVKTTQEETRALFEHIIDFSNTAIFKNEELGRQDDVKNLKLYLEHQFPLYDSSYRYPLSLVQLNELQYSKDPRAPKLYALHRALSKTNKHVDKLFDKLLSAVVIVKQLIEGVDFVILTEDIKNTKSLLQVTPIIKDQPSRKTVFGDGVQSFLHLLLEQQSQHKDLKGRFDVSIPSSTIFNISPKNFFDYYRLSGGRIIGMTGTAGSKEDIEEFRETNKMLTFDIPRYEVDIKIVKNEEVDNKKEQYQRVRSILEIVSKDRPIIIFAESTKEAEQVYQELHIQRSSLQLYAASQKDTTTNLKEILDNAGKDGYLTVTTPMLGRGTDFYTKHREGFLGINLCTNITYSTRMQIYGRVARNGHPGEIISIFNRELFGKSIESHMQEISEAEKNERMKTQPLTDILRYFNHIHQDQAVNAIECNEFITKEWDGIIKGKNNYLELRGELVQKLKEKYPTFTGGLDHYLEQIDSGVSEETSEKQLFLCPNHHTYHVAQTDHVNSYERDYRYLDWYSIGHTSRSTPISTIKIPSINDHERGLLYSLLAKVQSAVMATHAFDLKKNKFKFYAEYEYQLSPVVPDKDKIASNTFLVFLYNNKIYGQIFEKDAIEIVAGYTFEKGIPQNIYEGIKAKLQAIKLAELTSQEKAALNEHINAVGYNKSKLIDGEGSNDNLMSYEFKKSFAAYQVFAKSTEIDQIAGIINNFGEIVDIDTTRLRYGQYQAINITTEFTSSSSHAESILTDGRLLFWINRGGGSEGRPGIKVFKIIKDMVYVKAALDLMKEPHSETETRAKIYSLLREDSDKNIPGHILIPMSGQTIGNCGWTQTEGMFKAAAIVNRLRELNIQLSDYDKIKMFTESQEWQKVLKDSDDIYKDFITYDRTKRLEVAMFSMDKMSQSIFLNEEEQERINLRRQVVGNPITYELLESLSSGINLDHARYDNTIYEKPVSSMLDRIDLEIAIGSEMGKALQRVSGEQSARNILEGYQKNRQNDFAYLNKIYKKIEVDGVSDKRTQDALFVEILSNIIDSEYQYFLLQKSLKTNWSVFLGDAQKKIEYWRGEYGEYRPYG
ncbi:MAG: hypothetical protein WCH10_02435 [bacterium]